jgi:hypothetical protein
VKDYMPDPFLDADGWIHPDSLTRLAGLIPGPHASDGEADEIAGRESLDCEPETPVEWMEQLAEVTRAYQAAHLLVESQAELLGQTLASFGRL